MFVLYPIKPKYIDKILAGEKRCELRKRLPKKTPKYILLYCTWPVKQIVGYAVISETYRECTKLLWNRVHEYAGIDKNSYFEYFKDAEKACALKFKTVHKFSIPFDLSEIKADLKAPQSFCYLDSEVLELVKTKKTVEI